MFTSALDEIVAQQIEEKLNENFERYAKLDIAERIYETRRDRKIETKELEYGDQLVGIKLSEMNKQNGISLWDLIVLYHSAAVALLERLGKHLLGNHRINLRILYAVRRKSSHIDVILKWKKENRFTTRQKNLVKK